MSEFYKLLIVCAVVWYMFLVAFYFFIKTRVIENIKASTVEIRVDTDLGTQTYFCYKIDGGSGIIRGTVANVYKILSGSLPFDD